MRLAPGFRLGPYEVVAPLGAGGMGEVWRARDTKLDRDVALKFLPAAVADDPERLARFDREAKVLASLNHPNIAAIYGFHEHEGRPFLAMEMVPGQDLAERLAGGGLPVAEAIAVGRQIAEALETAHEQGIVHRDLKPANVRLTDDGKVKVLDFGLAKALDVAAASDPGRDPAASPTITSLGTVAGVILGTAAYMSPEQARGKGVDKRADIWAFGCLFYEMLTGTQLFRGETVSDTVAAILTRDLDVETFPADTPPALQRLIRRCLERNPRNRLHDIADARIVIDDLLANRPDAGAAAETAAGAGGVRGQGWWSRLLWLAGGVALGAVAAAGVGRMRPPAPSPRPTVVRSLTYSGKSGDASISADGKVVAFASGRDGQPRIWLKQLATGEEVALTSGLDFNPRVSPDSSSALFLRAANPGADLYRVPVVGGEPRRLARNVEAADWSPDGKRIVLARDLGQRAQLAVMPADGGEEKVLLECADDLPNVAWSPDGTRLAVSEGARVNTVGRRVLAVVDAASGERREVYRFPAGSLVTGAVWDGNDALLFAWSPTQAGRGEAVLQRLRLGSATPEILFSFTSMPARIELDAAGALAFDGGGYHQNLFDLATGRAIGRALTGGPTIDRQPAFSPDGRRVVFSSDRSGSLDLWTLDVGTGAVRRLTFDAADDWDPQWTPDGKHLIWSSNRTGHFEIWMAEPDGTGAKQVTADGVDAENPTMSADAAWIVYSSANPAAPGIWKIHPDGSGAACLLRGNFTIPDLSPATGWVAAVDSSSQAGRPGRRVRVVRLEDGSTVAEVQVPGEVGNTGRSRWMPDGRTLVSWGARTPLEGTLFRQPVVPGRDTTAQREVIAVSDDRRVIESFGVSPVDGRIVLSAGWGESDVMLAEGIAGVRGKR